MKKRSESWRLQPRHFVLGAAGLALAWLVISRTGAAFLATRSPELALMLHGSETNALLEVAQRTLDAALLEQRTAAEANVAGASPGERKGAADANAAQGASGTAMPTAVPILKAADAEKIADAATRALRTAPLEARALRILAQLADLSGDKDRKRRLLEGIVQRTKHETLASYWLMLEALEQKDYAGVVRFADVVLSRHPDLAPHVAPALVYLLENKLGDQDLKDRLKDKPVWRHYFFQAMTSAINDARTPLDLMLALKGSSAPPTDHEIRFYLNFLIGRQMHEIAYYAWLQMLDPEILKQVGAVHNGRFELPLTNMPFDWVIPSSPGATVAITTPMGETRKALHIEFGQGRVDFQGVHQYLVLTPGRYHLKVSQKGEVTGRRGLQWIVQCADNAKRLGETSMFLGKIAEWQEVEAAFSVPVGSCRLQQIRLHLAARSASEQLVKGAAWFTDAQIVKQIKD